MSQHGPRVPPRDAAELRGAPRCWVCGQMEDPQRARDTALAAALVGAAAYAICVRCGQEAPDPEDPEYRARAKRHLGAVES